MEYLSMCRICLATDVRLCSIASHLQDIYERISSMTFKREDSRPLVACYICHARLQNCYRLRTSCRRSEELLTEMMGRGALKSEDVLSTNTLSVVPVLRLSLGHAVHDSTECHIMEGNLQVICDAELNQQSSEDIKVQVEPQEYDAKIDDVQYSLLENALNVIKREPDDLETYVENIILEIEDMAFEENELNSAYESSLSAYNICPKIMEAELERITLNEIMPATGARVSKKNSNAAKKPRKAVKKPRTAVKKPRTAVKKPRNAATKTRASALKHTEDTITIKRKIEEEINEDIENISIMESKIETKPTRVKKPKTTGKVLKTCDKLDVNLITFEKCTSVVNDDCEKKITNDTSLEHNVSCISSSKNKQFSCDTCEKCFSNKSNLKTHIRIHTGEKPYKCNICKRCFKLKNNLKIHVRTHTDIYQCYICKISCNDVCDLKKHIRMHIDDYPYQCNICKRSFNSKYVLKNHGRSHSGYKPYKCNACKKCFLKKDGLNKHICIHTGDKLYQCIVCNKCFYRNCALKRHIRTHTGEKPYQCNVCKKCFSSKSSLKKHIRTHTGEKPYRCNFCKKCFNDLSNYSKHNRIHLR